MRDWFPLALAWAASATAIGLVTLHNPRGPFDPSLAVLTATLIAVIWYSYFTYQAVHKPEPTRVSVDLNFNGPDTIWFRVRSGSPDRNFAVRTELDVRIDDDAVQPIEPVLRGAEELWIFHTDPQHFELKFPDDFTPPRELASPSAARLKVSWSDPGRHGEDRELKVFRKWEDGNARLSRPSEIREFFPDEEGPR